MVASDRISTYDVVHPTPIPDKGKVLTGLSAFWFERTADICPNHLISSTEVPRGGPRPRDAGRAARDGAGRVRRARLHHRLGLEGLPGHRRGLRDRAAGRPAASPSSCPSRSSRRPPRPSWATTTRTSTSTARPRSSATASCSRSCAGCRSRSTGSAPSTRASAGSSSPTRSSSSAAAPTATIVLGRRGADPRLVALLAGRRLRARPRRSRASTSSTCATGPTGPGWDKTPPAPALPDDVVAAHPRDLYVEAYERIAGEPFERWLERASA